MIVLLTALAAAFGVPAMLTVQGQRRRGRGPAVALLAGAFFPLAWAVWYVADERPYGAS